MNPQKDQTATTPPPGASDLRTIVSKVFGKFGPLWAVALTALATLIRWFTDGLLADASPYSFYYLAVVVTALLSRMGSALLAVILGALCGHYIWVLPRNSMEFLNTTQVAQMVVFIVVATLCAFAVGAARILRVFDYIGNDD